MLAPKRDDFGIDFLLGTTDESKYGLSDSSASSTDDTLDVDPRLPKTVIYEMSDDPPGCVTHRGHTAPTVTPREESNLPADHLPSVFAISNADPDQFT